MRAALAALLALAAAGAWIRTDSRVVLLRPNRRASWIRAGVSRELADQPGGERADFRIRLDAPRDFPPATLEIGALRAAEVKYDGRLLSRIGVDQRAWKSPVRLELGTVRQGPHELEIEVSDPSGPAALEVWSENIPLETGETWSIRVGTGPWNPATSIDAPWDLPLASAFPSSGEALLSVFPALLPLFALVFAVASGWRRKELERLVPGPSALRWLLLALWTILGLNDLRRLPVYVGFDAFAHLRYLQTIALQHRLPTPDEGWQTFQAPLYYLLSAPLWNLLSSLAGFRLARFWIRLLPIAAGALQIEAAYRCARTVFPARADLQRVTVLVAALMPMNVYLSQAVGNEPLAGGLCAIAVALALAFRPGPRERRGLAVLGGVLGAAMLAKASAVLLVPPALALVAYRLARRGGAAAAAKGAGLAAVCAAAVCGWFYAGNLASYGTPIANMFAAASAWWQEPGYRTAAQLTSFGTALTHPVYAGVHGLWDSLYSTLWMDGYLSGVAEPVHAPPWNYSFMFASGLLALVPTFAIAAGFLRLHARARDEKNESLLFAGAVVALYAAAIVFVYLRLPIYSAGKASYMLGATPCLALLAASGFDALARNRAARAALIAALACWAFAVYAAYFVVAPFVPAGC